MTNRPLTVLQKKADAEYGFTLVELMVTIAVMGIIASIAIPNMSRTFADQRVKSTSATIASALNQAKAESRIRKRDMTVEYDSTNKKITVSEGTGSTKKEIAAYTLSSHSSITVVPSTQATLIISSIQRANATTTYQICDSGITDEAPYQVTINVGAGITQKQAGSC